MSIFSDTVTKGMEARTKEVFGDPLSPAESVKRVINDVIEKGDEALEYYSEKFEGVNLSAESIKIKTCKRRIFKNLEHSSFIIPLFKLNKNYIFFKFKLRVIGHRDKS